MHIISRIDNGIMICVLEGRVDSAGASQLDEELQHAPPPEGSTFHSTLPKAKAGVRIPRAPTV